VATSVVRLNNIPCIAGIKSYQAKEIEVFSIGYIAFVLFSA